MTTTMYAVTEIAGRGMFSTSATTLDDVATAAASRLAQGIDRGPWEVRRGDESEVLAILAPTGRGWGVEVVAPAEWTRRRIAAATRYRIVTESGTGMPAHVRRDGYGSEGSAIGYARQFHDGAWRVESYVL